MKGKVNLIKKAMLSLLIAAMLFSQSSEVKVTAAGISEVPEGYTAIYTADDLSNIRNIPNGKFILMNDINLASFSQGAGWEPIIQISYTSDGHIIKTAFSGVLDGNGYTINNLTINRPDQDRVGLFEEVLWNCDMGEIKNLRLANVNILGKNVVGAIAGNIGGKITNCTVSGSIKGQSFVGGIAGSADGGVLTNCSYSGNVTGTGTYVSSIVGQSIENTLVGCSSNATVKGSTGTLTGGMGNRQAGGFWYNVLNNEAEIYWYVPEAGGSGNVVIPSNLNGYPVTKISGFSGNQSITSLTIPDTLIEIGQAAFANLGQLTSVVIPTSVKNMGDYAFDGVIDYSGLKSITFENKETAIADSPYAITETGTIRGKANSTAQAYAAKYNRKFIVIP